MKISLKETKLETRNFKEKFSRGKEIMFLRKGLKKSVKIRKVRLKKEENQPLIIFFFSLSWIRYNTWVYTRVFFYLNNAFVCYFFCVIRQKSKVQTVYEKEWLIVRLLCALLIKKNYYYYKLVLVKLRKKWWLTARSLSTERAIEQLEQQAYKIKNLKAKVYEKKMTGNLSMTPNC